MIKLNSKNILNIFLPIGMILVMLYGGISLSVERYGKKNEHMSFHCFTQKDSLYLTARYRVWFTIVDTDPSSYYHMKGVADKHVATIIENLDTYVNYKSNIIRIANPPFKWVRKNMDYPVTVDSLFIFYVDTETLK